MSTAFREVDKGPTGDARRATSKSGFAQKFTTGGQLGLFQIGDDFIEGLQIPKIDNAPGINSLPPLRAEPVRTKSLLAAG